MIKNLTLFLLLIVSLDSFGVTNKQLVSWFNSFYSIEKKRVENLYSDSFLIEKIKEVPLRSVIQNKLSPSSDWVWDENNFNRIFLSHNDFENYILNLEKEPNKIFKKPNRFFVNLSTVYREVSECSKSTFWGAGSVIMSFCKDNLNIFMKRIYSCDYEKEFCEKGYIIIKEKVCKLKLEDDVNFSKKYMCKFNDDKFKLVYNGDRDFLWSKSNIYEIKKVLKPSFNDNVYPPVLLDAEVFYENFDGQRNSFVMSKQHLYSNHTDTSIDRGIENQLRVEIENLYSDRSLKKYFSDFERCLTEIKTENCYQSFLYNHQFYSSSKNGISIVKKIVKIDGVKHKISPEYWDSYGVTINDNRGYSWSRSTDENGERNFYEIGNIIKKFLKKPRDHLIVDINGNVFLNDLEDKKRIYFYKKNNEWLIKTIVNSKDVINISDNMLNAFRIGTWNEFKYPDALIGKRYLNYKSKNYRKKAERRVWPTNLRKITYKCLEGQEFSINKKYKNSHISCPAGESNRFKRNYPTDFFFIGIKKKKLKLF